MTREQQIPEGTVGAAVARAPESSMAAQARTLMARLREVMSSSGGTPQTRLDRIVRQVATILKSDVCSCYVLRAGEVLELFATLGLRQEAVHQTRLRVSEGLVGEVAATGQPLALPNAPLHPNFAYRPETGEDPFKAFLGVPILRGGRLRGVLVIQHRDKRVHSEIEIETLQNVAMVLAELVASYDLVDKSELTPVGDPHLLSTSRIDGAGLNGGIATGLAVLHNPLPQVHQVLAEDATLELKRLEDALAAVRSDIDALLAGAHVIDESREILESYRMFAADRGWLRQIQDAIRQGLTAEAAAARVQDDTKTRLGQATDAYLKERLFDLEDLTNRLLKHLAGHGDTAAKEALPDEIVLIAHAMGPAELLDYDARKIKALVLEQGTQASHVTIVAKSLGIPVVSQCQNLLQKIDPLDPVIVDGDNGLVYIRPGEDIQELYTRATEQKARRDVLYAEVRPLPSVSADGVPVSLHLNCGLPADFAHLATSGAEGVGLYRTEIPFMVRSTYPDVKAQTELYRQAFVSANGKPVVFRTLDVGGDKVLPYFPAATEANPVLGWRAIRLGLDRPAMMKKQVRAILLAAAGRPVSIMFPMVGMVTEFRAARSLVLREVETLRARGEPVPESLKLGTMLEVPSLLWQLPALLAEVDFLSVGTNDLMQYLFAVDRSNPRVSERFDPVSPPFLAVIRQLVRAAERAGKPLTICGEIAGRPLEAMALIGAGVRRLSMNPLAIDPVKTMIRSLDVARVSDYMNGFYDTFAPSIRSNLTIFAKDHNIIL